MGAAWVKKTLALVVSFAIGTSAYACSGADEEATPGSSGQTSSGASSGGNFDRCAIPAEGCACGTEGESKECGEVRERFDSYVACSMGTRTCQNGAWGACRGKNVAFKSIKAAGNTSGIKFADLSGPGACSASVNLCEPDCQSFENDNSNGMDADSGLKAVDGGFQLQANLSLCVGLQCNVTTSCPGGNATKITGVVRDPAGLNPVYNVLVYIPNDPNQALPAITDGPQLDQCGGVGQLPPSIAAAYTAPNGSFTLNDVPVGVPLRIVMQTGKWRRVVNYTVGGACSTTDFETIPTLKNQMRLPRNRAEGNIPRIAVVRSSCEAMECMMRRIGIDLTEFGAYDNASLADRRIHLFNAPGAGDPAEVPQPTALATLTVPPRDRLLETVSGSSRLNSYDIAMLPCDCGNEYINPIAARRRRLADRGACTNVGACTVAGAVCKGDGAPGTNFANWRCRGTCTANSQCPSSSCDTALGRCNNACATNADCETGTEACVAGICRQTCTTDAQCGGTAGTCTAGTCNVACVTNAQCRSSETCYQNACRSTTRLEQLANVRSYVNNGGRLMASHWGREWIENNEPDLKSVAAWRTSQSFNYRGFPVTDPAVNPGGPAFRDWLLAAGAMTTAEPWINVAPGRNDANWVNTALARLWVFGGTTGAPNPATPPAMPINGVIGTTADFTFDTPVGAANKFGRVMFSSMHLSVPSGQAFDPVSNTTGNGEGVRFPAHCTTGTLDDQEKAMEFLFNDLGSCLGTVLPPPVTYDQPGSFARDFEGVCPPGRRVVWHLFQWQTITPSDTKVEFRAQTADTTAALPSAAQVMLGIQQGAATTAWTGVDVESKLNAAIPTQSSKSTLRLSITLRPSVDQKATPTLLAWRQAYACEANE
jgi:hypothetical protein